jgi:uroporphyrinogen III methyltransferase/synthase
MRAAVQAGKVWLVGAGPGDPGLITVKGRRILEQADVILYDHLANPKLLELNRRAERIYVGKKRAEHACSQDEIIQLMIRNAGEGKRVVRLKGGDPFIFGRGGEEVEGLAAAGVPYKVVPGVTAPLGIAAYTGVPLTHREHTSVVSFVTGHDPGSIDWTRIGTSETLVIFMGLHHLDEIARELMRIGRSPATPAMVVRWGTRPDQRTVAGQLVDLPELVSRAGLTPPATIFVGDVVSLRDKLTWFERLPLFSLSVAITRAREQAAELVETLGDLGADVVELPVISLAPLEDYSLLDSCIARLETYHWVVFTSTNTVAYFFGRLAAAGSDARSIRVRICAIGPATQSALEARSLRPDLVPADHTSEGLAAAFTSYDMREQRILLPRAAAAREVIPAALAALGAIVDIADAYRNVVPEGAGERIRSCIAAGRKLDWITFTSPSTVDNFLNLGGGELARTARLASIGRTTSAALGKHGLEVHAEAESATIDSLVSAIVRASSKKD